MLKNLIEDLKVLAENILKEEQGLDAESSLFKARELYEKLLVLSHVQKEEEREEILKKEPITELPEVAVPEVEEIVEEVSINEENDTNTEYEGEIEAPMSLNDLFVPTFDGIKEDMSQKDEFKDTISLDETENMFQNKKEESKQLSLNDKLVGSSIQIGLNDRIAFVNKLFNFSQSDFNKALTRLNDCSSKEEALKYFQYQIKPNYNWKGKEELEERLVSLIERKFL